ncbi:hypothetical protein [Butyrivibrio hungatei]|uniref:Uncharacterized protein n=1 Tax=Butyrivibrio hungatei TaxID=185008 RepID=A0A1D9P5L5_9FIRM|nr:hypothetical protein [Butyrivibrio hungatei]AOZ97860.1 hypothetical protein bhn_II061 [Butyrivibrio hungatei]
MIDVSLAMKFIGKCSNNTVGDGDYCGAYDLTYELQREKFLDVLRSRMFERDKTVNYDVVISDGHVINAGGFEVDTNEDIDVFLERYDIQYRAVLGTDYYSKLIKDLERLGIFEVISIYEDELAELNYDAYSGEDASQIEKIMRGLAESFLSKRELLEFNTARFTEAVPEFVDDLYSEWDVDPTLETLDKYYIVYESSIIGRLLTLDVADSDLTFVKELLNNKFMGLNTRIASDGTFYCWGIFGADEMYWTHLCDLPANSGAQVALVTALAERYGLISKKEDIEQCEKVAA